MGRGVEGLGTRLPKIRHCFRDNLHSVPGSGTNSKNPGLSQCPGDSGTVGAYENGLDDMMILWHNNNDIIII